MSMHNLHFANFLCFNLMLHWTTFDNNSQHNRFGNQSNSFRHICIVSHPELAWRSVFIDQKMQTIKLVLENFLIWKWCDDGTCNDLLKPSFQLQNGKAGKTATDGSQLLQAIHIIVGLNKQTRTKTPVMLNILVRLKWVQSQIELHSLPNVSTLQSIASSSGVIWCLHQWLLWTN